MAKTEIKNGKFLFKGSINESDLVYVTIEGERKTFPLFLENSKISITADINKIIEKSVFIFTKIEGSKSHSLYDGYLKYKKTLYEKGTKYDIYRQQIEENSDPTRKKKLENLKYLEIEKNSKLCNKYIDNIIKNNPNSVVGTHLLTINDTDRSFEDLKLLVNVFSSSVKNTRSYKERILKPFERLKRTQISCIAPDFTALDSQGNEKRLHTIKAKCLIIDFWASWCAPCRASFPHMKEIYAKYHSEGLEIIGVSADARKTAWEKALEKDQLPWIQVIDACSEKNGNIEIMGLYATNQLPTILILDENKTIVAKNLHGEDLDKKIEELLGL